jgi:hypothetical protein
MVERKRVEKVIAYTRVSTEEQVANGVSLDAQAAAIRAYCTMRSLALEDVVTDAGASAPANRLPRATEDDESSSAFVMAVSSLSSRISWTDSFATAPIVWRSFGIGTREVSPFISSTSEDRPCAPPQPWGASF